MSNAPLKDVIKEHLGDSGVRLFDMLKQQKPEKADSIVLLQGDRLDRVPATYALYEQGYAEQILISGNDQLIGEGTRSNENDVALKEIQQSLMELGVPKENILIEDQSLNTLQQAVNILNLAREKGWSKLIIVTSEYHLLRSYLTFVKQMWEGRIIMYAAEFPLDYVPSGRTKNVREMFLVEMEKITRYKSDLAPIVSLVCKVRKVGRDDVEDILKIRNHSEVRKNSIENQEIIALNQHKAWMEKQYFGNEKNICFVLECNGLVVGYCRFDWNSETNRFRISIALSSDFHGRGLGSMLLEESLELFDKGTVIEAYIRKENVPSLKLFAKHGFVKEKEGEIEHEFICIT